MSKYKVGDIVLTKDTEETVEVKQVLITSMGRHLYYVKSKEFDPSYSFYEHELESIDEHLERHGYSDYIDNVNNPKHYTEHPSGIECIQITEHMGFNLGNAFKYVFRSELKNGLQDLKKSIWYLERELERRSVTHIWKTIPSADQYEVSTLGEIRNKETKRLRKLVKLKNGYLTFGFIDKNTKKHKLKYVHRCVAEAFFGKSDLNVCHFDGNKENNFMWNLRYATHKENSLDRYRHGTHFNGKNNPSAKLTEEQVERIRDLYGMMSETKCAKIFNVSGSTIGRIWRGISWKNVETGPPISCLISGEENENKQKIFHHIWNAHLKGNAIEDLKKAKWYIDREIKKREVK